ncbi:MAG TPA: hypothetical protein VFQ53_11060 [Kofleriaceae bacterium]|nr:hypothetical protein [Kofleriaceae bacterium]
MTTCSGCGAQMAPQNVLYTSTADPVCAKCYAKADIVATDQRAAANIKRLAVGSALGGLLAFFSPLSGFGIVVIASIIFAMASGIWALQSMARGNERFTQHLQGSGRAMVWVLSVFGIAVAGFSLLMWFGILPFLLR